MAGAPVCITSVHLDRSSKSLLKGKPGTIVDWELSEKLPAGDKGEWGENYTLISVYYQCIVYTL